MYQLKKYFIDTENVAGKWLDVLNEVKSKKEEMEFFIFYTKNTSSISYSNMQMIFNVNSNIKIHFMECCCGRKNALDFHLVAEVAKQSMKAKKSQFIIVSDDKGYDPFIETYKHMGYDMHRLGFKDEKSQIVNVLDENKNSKDVAILLKNIAMKYNVDEAQLIHLYKTSLNGKTIAAASPEEKQRFHNLLLKVFKTKEEDKGKLYQEIKKVC